MGLQDWGSKVSLNTRRAQRRALVAASAFSLGVFLAVVVAAGFVLSLTSPPPLVPLPLRLPISFHLATSFRPEPRRTGRLRGTQVPSIDANGRVFDHSRRVSFRLGCEGKAQCFHKIC